MLGCFVGPANLAASGVPERFLDKSAIGKTVPKPSSESQGPSSTNKVSASTAPGGNTPATGQTEPMDVSQ